MRALAALLLVFGLLAGCGKAPREDSTKVGNNLHERTVLLRDGREVVCVVFIAGYKGGLSCDWDGAK